MEMEKMEGMVCGYNKKVLAMIAVLVIVAGGAFYAGAKYEKNKLSRLGLLKKDRSAVAKTKKPKQQPAVDITDQMNNLANDTNNTDGNAPASVDNQAPVVPTNAQ